MKKYLIISLLVSSQVFAQNDKLTLQQCISTAHASNLQVKQNELQVENNLVNLRQAKANQLPQVNASWGYGLNFGRSIDPFSNSFVNEQVSFSNVGISAGVTVFNGMQLVNQVRQNTLSVQASQMDVQQVKDQLTLNVLLAYLQVLSNEEQINVAQRQAESTQKQVERIEILVKEGAAPVANLMELKAQWANDKLVITNAQNATKLAKVSLMQLMNLSPNPNVQVEKLETSINQTAYDLNSEQVFDAATRSLGIIKGADLRVQSAERGIAVAKSNFFPYLSLGGSMGTTYSSAATEGYFKQLNNNQRKGIGLNLSIPILNGFVAKNRVSQANVFYKTTQNLSQQNRLQLRQFIETAYQNFDAAVSRLQSTREQVQWQEEAFKMAEVRFENGAINAADYNLAKSRLDQARFNLVQARYDYLFRTKILDFYSGRSL